MTPNNTVLLKHRQQMMRKPLGKCHGGKGALDWIGVLGKEDLKDRRLNFIHDDVLTPGVSIGKHKHTEDEEYYYVVSGNGTMTLDEQRIEVAPGDITAVFSGGIHGLENTGSVDLRVIVISVSSLAERKNT